jgi:osmotically-inducible protein OsmY
MTSAPTQIPTRAGAAALAVVLATGIAACDRADPDRSTGQKVDSAVAQTEQKGAQMEQDIKQAGREAGESMSNAAGTVAAGTRDAAITTEVNAKLVADKSLSALAINVDTSGGRVTLKGTAPDSAARTHATEIARGVVVVVSVSKELNVDVKP